MLGKYVTKCKLEDSHSRVNRITINPIRSDFHLTKESERTLAEGEGGMMAACECQEIPKLMSVHANH